MSQATPTPQSFPFIQQLQARLGRRGAFWIGGSVVTLGIVLFVWFLFQPSGAAGSPGVLAPGQQAPNFTLASTAGKQVSLSHFQGHPVVVNFWSTTCGPCQSETPLLQRTLQQHQAQGLVVLGVDQGEEMSAITQFGKNYELSYPLLADTHLAVNHQYGVTGLPVSYFIDGKGTIRAIVNGVLQTNTLQNGLTSIGITG
jgi:cytochrome c biogenesis protein CcmG, thiol:disulfide interchange protein DsbE